MGLRKCPKCEINYIRDDQELCEVCSRKHKLREHDEEESDVVLCAECGERPAMKGKELCKRCYAERTMGERPAKKAASDGRDFDNDDADNEESDDDVSFSDDEIDDEIDDDIDDDMDDDVDDDEIDPPGMMEEEDAEFVEEKVNYVINDNYTGSIYTDD